MEKEKFTISFDMDGTIADLYGVDSWLEKLCAEDVSPYLEAKPLVRMASLARVLNRLGRDGYRIGIISWTSKGASPDYEVAIANAKREWLARHLPSVKFDFIDIIPYGYPKDWKREGILFDDNAEIRARWGDNAFDEKSIMEILRTL